MGRLLYNKATFIYTRRRLCSYLYQSFYFFKSSGITGMAPFCVQT